MNAIELQTWLQNRLKDLSDELPAGVTIKTLTLTLDCEGRDDVFTTKTRADGLFGIDEIRLPFPEEHAQAIRATWLRLWPEQARVFTPPRDPVWDLANIDAAEIEERLLGNTVAADRR